MRTIATPGPAGAPAGFYRYPSAHVVAVVDPADLASMVEGLVAAGIDLTEVQVLTGADGRDRLDNTGLRHGLLTRVQRRLAHALSSDSQDVLALMDRALRCGRALVAAPLRPSGAPVDLDVAALLFEHGALISWSFRRWSIEVSLG